jgi:hypothetical protein
MRVEMPVVPQSMIESSKPLEKKEFTGNRDGVKPEDESLSFAPLPGGIGGTYSISSLKAAVEYNAKYLTVAENNVEAARNSGMIPQALLDHLNGRLNTMA